MGKKAKARRESVARPVEFQHPLRSSPNVPLLILSGIGVLLAGYMAWTALGGGSVKGCGVGSGCDVVLNSDWAKLLGLPTAFWGFLAYVTLAATAFIRRADRHWQISWSLALFGFLYSLYLTTISFTVLQAACPYCLTSLALMTAIFGVLTWQRPDVIEGFAWPGWLAKTAPVAAALIVLVHLSYSGVIGAAAEPDDPIAKPLAEHLVQSGAKMYGASWCPHCKEQKHLFGTAARLLPYVECSPNGQGTAQAPECKAQNIETYPTWIINGKHMDAVLSLPELATASGFVAPATPQPGTSSN